MLARSFWEALHHGIQGQRVQLEVRETDVEMVVKAGPGGHGYDLQPQSSMWAARHSLEHGINGPDTHTALRHLSTFKIGHGRTWSKVESSSSHCHFLAHPRSGSRTVTSLIFQRRLVSKAVPSNYSKVNDILSFSIQQQITRMSVPRTGFVFPYPV